MNEFSNSTTNVSGIGLTEEIRETLLNLGALGWPEDDIAVYFGWDRAILHNECANPDSEISKILLRGRLQKRAEVEIRLMKEAIGGNLTAAKQYADIVRDKSFQLSKLDIFGGPADEGAFQRIQDYIASGCPGTLSEKEQLYIDLLVMIYSLDGQYGKRYTIRFLTRKPFCLSYQRASDMYAEAVELFFSNRKVSKEALRAKMADQFDTLYSLAMSAAKTPKEYEMAANILAQKAKIQRLDQEDPEVLPPAQYQKRFRLLSLTPEVIGLPPANRDVMAAQIDSILEPGSVKKRLRMEAGIEDVDIVELLENVVQEED